MTFMYYKNIILPCRKLQFVTLFQRSKSSLGLWEEDLNTQIKLNIEKHWSKEVLCGFSKKKDQNSYYVLPMFPYPSGNLHMGHVRVYSISDTIARFQQLSGNNVIHPMGWDAFGLPAENAAIEHNIPPCQWTRTNIQAMKKQLYELGFNFDWNREISTCDPQYYKWTQYIFIKLFEKGLAYQNKAVVNWDPVDKTVLADEQVDEDGRSWRSGAKVEKKILTQWFIRTTKFAKHLYDGLSNNCLENWEDIINLQRHWIGECNGVVVTFKLKLDNEFKSIDIWSPDPYKFIHGEFLAISKSNIIVQDLLDTNNLIAFNPITNSEIPVHVTDIVDYAEGRDTHIACPLSDPKDEQLARSLNIIPKGDTIVDFINENQRAVDIALEKNVGGYYVSSKLKDWLISRQRFWGTPIPIIHCTKCGTVPVPYDELPVKLPEADNTKHGMFTPTKLNEWASCKCPICKDSATRETDTMDTFVDSSWYYYRFLDPDNKQTPFNKEKLLGNTPVNLYIGGKEHAVLHLYYARFMSYFLHSLGLTPAEPFKKLLVQGMVMGQSYKLKSSGRYIPNDSVVKVGNEYIEKTTGEPVLVQWEKMSKSKYNGENPERLLSAYGCDTTRLFILADVPPATSRHWSDSTFPGILNWQHRLWLTIREFLKHRNDQSLYNNHILSTEQVREHESKIFESRNYFIATATFHFKHSHKLSVGISRLQGLTNVLRNNIPPEMFAKSREFELALANLIIMLAPVAPHFCSELWAGFQSAPNRISEDVSLIDWHKNVLEQKWPKVDNSYKLSLQCKVDGANRCMLKIKATDLANLNEPDALQLMTNEKEVAKRIKKGILKTKYELYPGCRAILYIYTKRAVQSNKLKAVT